MKVAIAGYGAEGQSSYHYYVDKGEDVTIVAQKLSPDFTPADDARVIVGEDAYHHLNDYDLVMRTPPLAPSSITTRGKIWSQTNEFLAQCPALVVGVTGTKGKGTTASLIASILRTSGVKVHLVGNIGVVPLTVLDAIASSDIVVYEMSSFQLWDAEKSPHIAVVTMVEPDHLDAHSSLKDYIDAKSRITRFQTDSDTVIYHPTNTMSQSVAMAGNGKKIRYATMTDGGVYVEDGYFKTNNKVICSTSALKIPGIFNQENACAAITAALLCGGKKDFVESGLLAFDGLQHRLSFVRSFNEVDYYDDSIATTIGSAVAAIRSFDGKKILILGGSDKGIAYDELIDVCKQENVRVVAIGQTGQTIAELCDQKHVEYDRITGLMPDILQHIRSIAEPGTTVILSPASASFDQYKSYSDRGEKFIAEVEAMK